REPGGRPRRSPRLPDREGTVGARPRNRIVHGAGRVPGRNRKRDRGAVDLRANATLEGLADALLDEGVVGVHGGRSPHSQHIRRRDAAALGGPAIGSVSPMGGLTMGPTTLSEAGPRENNEDAAFESPRLVAVADGVGGAVAGELASQLAINAMAALDKRRLQRSLEVELADAVA